MSRTNSSWFTLWGAALPKPEDDALPQVTAQPTSAGPPNLPDNHTEQVTEQPQDATTPAEAPENPPSVFVQQEAPPAVRRVPKGRSKSATVRASSPTKLKSLAHKASTTSLASVGNAWLSWAPKTSRSGSQILKETDGEDDKEDEEQPEETEGDDGNEDREDDDDDQPDNDEIDDHVAHDSLRKKAWSFWNGAPEDTKEKKDKKDPERHTSISNKIFTSTPSFPSKEDLKSANKAQDASSVDSAGGQEEPDDAVLYKPHDGNKQFNKINTHKNENLRENVIVPDWSTCLHNQNSVSSSTLLSSSLFPEKGQSLDIKGWKNYLTHLSSRFGFGSSTQQPDSYERTDRQLEMEKELNLLTERNYKLYGKSLTKLPHHKRGCLPNFNRYYTRPAGQENSPKRQKTQLEEDAEDANAISITNDALGNLLINHKGPRSQKQPYALPSEVVNTTVGPLRKIKKILIIGVHGFFPTRMIRPLIGAPKGTSAKFANEAEKAVIRYCVENDLINDKDHNVSIQKIALEKEGKIFDRVEFFLEILTKWQEELNDADFIFFAAHSQGCVVSVILLARLIKLGILKNPLQKRIGILGMAGVNCGPFYGIDKSFFMKAYSAIEHDSLNELFELTKFDTPQSLSYKEAIQIIINSNVKICFIGSINDQLVPLYSALASHVFHPNIYRACYIDYSSKTPAFIRKLVSICCKLQNLGYFDNNVIKELSAVLAGPLTGSGHSKIYNDGKVYDLGIKFALDTDDLVIPCTAEASIGNADAPGTEGAYDELVQVPVTNQVYLKEYNIGKIGTNPFILPWCLRGLVFNVEKNWPAYHSEIMVREGSMHMSGIEEINSLYELFDRWKPDLKVLKDLKFRLNGIRASKL